MTPQADNALTALERARQAQERFERRIDVQLRLNWATEEDERAAETDVLIYGVSYAKAVCEEPIAYKRVDPQTIREST